MAEDMIEKTAEAIDEALSEHSGVEAILTNMDVEEAWALLRSAARAAIEALREPTEAMLDAGFERMDYNDFGGEHADAFNRNTAGSVFKAIIDSILTPHTESEK